MTQPDLSGRVPIIPPQPSIPSVPVSTDQTATLPPPTTLQTTERQYPNLPREWFISPEAHGGLTAAFRSLFDMNYDLQDAVQLLTSSNPGTQVNMQLIQGSQIVNPSQRAHYLIAAPTAASLTLPAPRSGLDDGIEITWTSATAHAHTITATGLLQTGTASVNQAAFAAYAGASLHLVAQSGLWNVRNSNAVSFS